MDAMGVFFGVIGFAFGTVGLVLSITAIARVTNLEKKLTEFDVLPENFYSANGHRKNVNNN